MSTYTYCIVTKNERPFILIHKHLCQTHELRYVFCLIIMGWPQRNKGWSTYQVYEYLLI